MAFTDRSLQGTAVPELGTSCAWNIQCSIKIRFTIESQRPSQVLVLGLIFMKPQGLLWSLGILVGKQAGPRSPGLSAELVKHCPWGPDMQDLVECCLLSPV